MTLRIPTSPALAAARAVDRFIKSMQARRITKKARVANI
jgi:hypothetical protein